MKGKNKYILTIATHFEYFLGFSKLYEQSYAKKMLKIPFFHVKNEKKEKISDRFFFVCFFSSPHIPDDKWHSQKEWHFRFSVGGYLEM